MLPHVYTYTYKDIYIYIYIYLHTYTRIHAYMRTYMLIKFIYLFIGLFVRPKATSCQTLVAALPATKRAPQDSTSASCRMFVRTPSGLLSSGPQCCDMIFQTPCVLLLRRQAWCGHHESPYNKLTVAQYATRLRPQKSGRSCCGPRRQWRWGLQGHPEPWEDPKT